MTWRVQQTLLIAEIGQCCVHLLQLQLWIFLCELPWRRSMSLLNASRELPWVLFNLCVVLMTFEKVHDFKLILYFLLSTVERLMQAILLLMIFIGITFNKRTLPSWLEYGARWSRVVTNINNWVNRHVTVPWPMNKIISDVVNLIITQNCSSRHLYSFSLH